MLKLAATLLLLVCTMGLQNTPHVSAQNDNPSRFELFAEKTAYHVAEPVELTVRLYNNQDEPIKGQFDLSLSLKQVSVYHRKVGGQFIRYFPYWLKSANSWDTSINQSKIPAQGSKESRTRLFYNSSIKQFVLSEPGEYEFQAIFRLPKVLSPKLYESNIVRITVVEPSEKERSALAALRDPELAALVEGDLRTVFVGNEKVESGAEKAAAFLENYSSSFYAPLVQERLMFVLNEAFGKRE
jgi:hypothetical protein